jgi:CRISPR-associated protein Cmr3
MTNYYFVEPTDALFVRGNLAFGDSGEHGSGVMPPPPSLLAGAFRSAILGRDADALARFTGQGATGSPTLDRALGTLDPGTGRITEPGGFRIAWLTLAGLTAGKGALSPEPVFTLPADLIKLESGFAHLTPEAPNLVVADGRTLPLTAMLRTAKQTKPEAGFYLREVGWRSHIAGNIPDQDIGGIKATDLYARDPRLGIGLNTDTRTAESGLIYTTEGHAFSPSRDPTKRGQGAKPFVATGFLVGVEGAEGLLPEAGFLRLGGDGRGARYRKVTYQPQAQPLDAIAKTGRFRLILATPGLFSSPPPPGGQADAREPAWLPTGVRPDGDQYRLSAAGCTARLVCAAVPRREVISGWDLFGWRPKDAHRVAPAGSVYWFEDFQGDPGKLAGWVSGGVWGDNPDTTRRAEGFNLAWLATWK